MKNLDRDGFLVRMRSQVVVRRALTAMATVALLPLAASAQRGANFTDGDIPRLVEQTLQLALNDTLLVGRGRGALGVDLDLAAAMFRAASRTRIPEDRATGDFIHPRLTRTPFFEAWDCPQRTVSVECKLVRVGEFLTIYAIEPSTSGDEVTVWVSLTSKAAASSARVRIVARAFTFSRDTSGRWYFVKAGSYLVS